MRVAIDLAGDVARPDLLAALFDAAGDRVVAVVVPAADRPLVAAVRGVLDGRPGGADVLRVWTAPEDPALAPAARMIHAALLAGSGAEVVLSLPPGPARRAPDGPGPAPRPPQVVLLDAAPDGDDPAWDAAIVALVARLAPADRLLLPDARSADRARGLAGAAAAAVLASDADDPRGQADAALRACAAALSDAAPAMPADGERPRLALVAPLPPARSGIAEYALQLLAPLSRHYRIDLVTDQEQVDPLPPGTGVTIRDPDWLRGAAGEVDRVLYHFGNAPLHGFMFDLLRDVPGVVVLHDFFLLDGRSAALPEAEFFTTILRSHGLHGLFGALALDPAALEVWPYPGNLEVLQQATGVIVHGEEPCRLAADWYGPGSARDWHIIPLLRPVPEGAGPGRDAARARLGIGPDEIVLCSFGHVGPTKLNLEIVEALAGSRLATDARVRLVFVGDAPRRYRARMKAAMSALPAARCRITGWVDGAAYADYLQAADIAIQLRSQSRGETSASVLDCLVHGLPTIVNAHGSMRDLDPDAVIRLPDHVDRDALRAAMERLVDDPALRAELGARARGIVAPRHAPETCAEAYRAAIEAAVRGPRAAVLGLPDRIAGLPLAAPDRLALAGALAATFPPSPRRPTIFVDVSAVAEKDIHTGIQRVTRSILRAFLAREGLSHDVVPVRLDPSGRYRVALRYAERLLGHPPAPLPEPLVDVARGDLFLVLDLDFGQNPRRRALFEGFRNAGARVWHVVYDLLPVRLPQYFPAGTEPRFAEWLDVVGGCDGAACISAAVAGDLADWLADRHPDNPPRPRIGWFHLGADLQNSVPTRGLPEDAEAVLAQLAAEPSFLMVGTIEPRKGHVQALDAFERLWQAGVAANLVIVGKRGWHTDAVVRRLRTHPQAGQRLFWLEDISDEYLEKVYAAGRCLIVASEGEGFGLPLIEAARHDLPILARDIPVFREVAGAHALYFSGLEPEALAQGVETWLADAAAGRTIRSGGIGSQTWEASAAQLLGVLGIGTGPAETGPDRPTAQGL